MKSFGAVCFVCIAHQSMHGGVGVQFVMVGFRHFGDVMDGQGYIDYV